MRVSLFALGIITGGTLLTGCAGVTVRHFDVSNNPCADHSDLGIRYYEDALHIVVVRDSRNNFTAKTVWLPDTTVIHSARPYNFFAKNETTLKFNRGVLTSAASEVDTTEFVVKAIQLAVQTASGAAGVVTEAAAHVAETPAEPKCTPMVYVYRVGVGECGEPKLYRDETPVKFCS